MSVSWGNVPGWVALLVVAIRGVFDFFSWRGRRKRERLERGLSTSDRKILRQARKHRGKVTIDTDGSGDKTLAIGGKLYHGDSQTDSPMKLATAVERMARDGLFKSAGQHINPDGEVKTYQLTNIAYRIIEDTPSSEEPPVDEF